MASAARPDATNAKTTLVHGIRGEAGCNQLHTYSAHSAYILRSLSAPPRRGWGKAVIDDDRLAGVGDWGLRPRSLRRVVWCRRRGAPCEDHSGLRQGPARSVLLVVGHDEEPSPTPMNSMGYFERRWRPFRMAHRPEYASTAVGRSLYVRWNANVIKFRPPILWHSHT